MDNDFGTLEEFEQFCNDARDSTKGIDAEIAANPVAMTMLMRFTFIPAPSSAAFVAGILFEKWQLSRKTSVPKTVLDAFGGK